MIRLRHISKRFGATRALDDVSLDAGAGEVLAVVGENGAGKTTLMRIAAGELTADSGTIALECNTSDVAMVHQHFMLVAAFTIAENIALAVRRRDAGRVIEESGMELRDPSRLVADLSVGEKSKLELIKAVATHPRVLILDEPTSVLTPAETEELFAVMRRFAAAGTAIVFISHKLPEVLAIADRIVVMREGRVVAENLTNADDLARAMVERRTASPGRRGRAGEPALRSGSITAIIGVAGNGQTELAAKLRDEHPEAAFIPEDRTRDGIFASMSIAENLALRGHRNAEEIIRRYSIKARSPKQRAGSLSGGNQQKVVLARELERHPEMLVAAEPTRGLDIESTAFVHDRLRAAADAGTSILLITSDLDEAFALAETIQVIYRGTLSERMTPQVAAERAPALMAGLGTFSLSPLGGERVPRSGG